MTVSQLSIKESLLAQRIYLILAALFICSLVVSNLIFQKFFSWDFFGLYTFEISVGILPYPITFLITDIISEIYGKKNISERHRHRFEVNNKYKKQLSKKGLRFSGICPQNNLVEIVELPNHPWFIAVQFHPELRSRVAAPHPLFVDFVRASLEYKANREQ